MSFNIEKIKAELEYGGTRPSLFNVKMTLPSALESTAKDVAERKLIFLCQAASIPASTIGSINVPYMGRKIKVAGNRTFAPWEITVLNDEDFVIRKVFEEWMQAINDHTLNIRSRGVSSAPADYKTIFTVRQYAKDDDISPLRKYEFRGIFPTEVSAITLNWDTENEIETFTVTLDYDEWVIDESID